MPIGVMSDEVGKMAATGLIDGGVGSGSLLELLQAETDRDKRRTGIDNGSIEGHFAWLTRHNAAFGYYVDPLSINECWMYIADRYYDPKVREDIPPKPQNVDVTGGVITADPAPAGYTQYIYSWNFTTFSVIGPLSEHSSPGAGSYVLVSYADIAVEGTPSISSGFITVT